MATSEEVARNMFKTYDKNGDGKISFDELKEIHAALGWNQSAEEVRKAMAEMDKDGDGFIDQEEFIAFNKESSSNENQELKQAFDMYDLDGDGVITANELHSVLRKLGGKCTLSDCKKMISQVDKNGDGKVNFEEFKKMMNNA
ncbi:hypothetical protein SLEP1_g55523 [Rubroshorea leprosula]|uniref:EF-hand domain-containing protein n=1 Tax=Rubroshorea leprosula TaxID=152421 RepID=A0AAV5LMG9_9ROSI|nr:hypothetical protein SLEP1_g46519 [Rubroshorea leprosula]GKV48719.1 hypothetical protein SLEP1_g55523 [Rubroshorea leprosula]